MKRFGFAAMLFVVFLLNAGFNPKDATNHNTLRNNKIVGASASELLTADKPSIVLEINYMPGFQLKANTIQHLVTFIQNNLNKPGGIQIIEKQIPAVTKKNLTIEDIAQIENENRTAYNTSRQVAVYFLVTNGSGTDPIALGTSYRNTSIAIFGKSLNRIANGYSLTIKSKLETSTIEHEFGHLIGLVNLPQPEESDKEIKVQKGHCNNPGCLMYYKSRTSELAGYLKGANVLALDADCRNILKNSGGK